MMGHRQVEQAALFYEFSLERHVPSDHLVRPIDRFVELGELRRELAPFYSAIGRPSVDPELMIRMLIIGYCSGIRSERRLCEEVHLAGRVEADRQPASLLTDRVSCRHVDPRSRARSAPVEARLLRLNEGH